MAVDKHLHQITLPVLNTDFGKNLQDQFKNINNNFQKLAAMKMYEGPDGKNASYIVYNLNAMFFYPVGATEADKKAFQLRVAYSSSNTSLQERIQELKSDLDKDFARYNELTGRTQEQYAQDCFRIYLGFTQPNSCRIINTAKNGTDNTYIPMIEGQGVAEYETITEADINGSNSKDVGWSNFKASMAGAVRTKYISSSRSAILAATPFYSAKGGYIASNRSLMYATWILDWAMADTGDQTAPLETKYSAAWIFNENIGSFDPGKITVAAVAGEETESPKPVGSLPYIFIDPRYRNTQMGDYNNYPSVDQTLIQSTMDISCVLYSEPSEDGYITFKTADPFPQLYYNDGQFYWSINGQKTGIPASGVQGLPGKNSQFIIAERMENIHYDKVTAPTSATEVGNIWPHPVSIPQYKHPSGDPTKDWNNYYTFSPLFKPYYDPVTNPDYTGWLQASQGKYENTSADYAYRIWGIAGGKTFWRTPKTTGEQVKIKCDKNKDGSYQNPDSTIYDIDASGYLKYKDGNTYVYDLVPETQADSADLYQYMADLDGVPCIVIPGQAFQQDHYDTSFWFSTLKTVKYIQKGSAASDNRIMVTAYCGPENIFRLSLDEHTFEGMMMGLDVYDDKFDRLRAFHNKPRGLMLPIGSRFIDSATTKVDASREFAAHIMYSDLGPWNKMQTRDAKNNTMTVSDSHSDKVSSTYKSVWGKYAMHIGSVLDYRALNEADLTNPAVPGRPGVSATDKAPGTDYKNYAQAVPQAILNIDEPVLITNQRDTFFHNDLLNVEGSIKIKMTHQNDGNVHPGGGLLVEGILTNSDSEDNVKEGEVFYTDNQLTNLPSLTNTGSYKSKSLGDYNYQYPFTSLKSISADNFGYVSWNGYPYTQQDGVNSLSNKDINYWGSIIDKGLRAGFVHARKGIAVSDTANSGTPTFSVDKFGNMQTTGDEIRSNSLDTKWFFHTAWTTTNANKMLFGTDHTYIKSGSSDIFWPAATTSKYNVGDHPGNTYVTRMGYWNGPGRWNNKVDQDAYDNSDKSNGWVTMSSRQNKVVTIEGHPAVTAVDFYTDQLNVIGSLSATSHSPWNVSNNHHIRYSGQVGKGMFVGGYATVTSTDTGTYVPKRLKLYEVPDLILSPNGSDTPFVNGDSIDTISVGGTSYRFLKGQNALGQSWQWWGDRVSVGDKNINLDRADMQSDLGLYVESGAIVEGDVYVGGNERVRGTAAVGQLNVLKNASIKGSVYMEGDILLKGSIIKEGVDTNLGTKENPVLLVSDLYLSTKKVTELNHNSIIKITDDGSSGSTAKFKLLPATDSNGSVRPGMSIFVTSINVTPTVMGQASATLGYTAPNQINESANIQISVSAGRPFITIFGYISYDKSAGDQGSTAGEWNLTLKADRTTVPADGGTVNLSAIATRTITYADGTTKTETTEDITLAETSDEDNAGSLNGNIYTFTKNETTKERSVTITATVNQDGTKITGISLF